MLLAVVAACCNREGGRIRADKAESSVNFDGAVSLLASLKRGFRDGRCRTLQNTAFEENRQQRRGAGDRFESTVEGSSAEHRKRRLRLIDVVLVLWVVLLLSIVAYALADGAAVFAQLDELDLGAAYSLAP
jgi:hypothetical protein